MFNKVMNKAFAVYKPQRKGAKRSLPGVSVLGLHFENIAQLEAAVIAGFDYSAVKSIMQHAGLIQSELADILCLRKSALAQYARQNKTLPQQPSEKRYRLAQIIERAQDVIGKGAEGWLHEPVLALSNRTPLDAMKNDIGASRVLQILERLDHGVYS